jgi:hypothetical protein
VPSAGSVSFAPFWLQDKGAFQSDVVTLALDLTHRGLIPDAHDLVSS